MKTDKPFMMVLAEKSATKRDISKLLEKEAHRWLEGKKAASQQHLVAHLDSWLNRFEFSGFSRKKTIEQTAARVMRRRGFWRIPTLPDP